MYILFLKKVIWSENVLLEYSRELDMNGSSTIPDFIPKLQLLILSVKCVWFKACTLPPRIHTQCTHKLPNVLTKWFFWVNSWSWIFTKSITDLVTNGLADSFCYPLLSKANVTFPSDVVKNVHYSLWTKLWFLPVISQFFFYHKD